jgi:hypothetical protein
VSVIVEVCNTSKNLKLVSINSYPKIDSSLLLVKPPRINFGMLVSLVGGATIHSTSAVPTSGIEKPRWKT